MPLALNLAGVVLLACGIMGASWPMVMTLPHPWIWRLYGAAAVLLGIALIRI